MEIRRCHLKYFQLPNYWEVISESIESADDALARMKDIESMHVSKESEHVSLYVEDSGGDKLHIGFAGDVWMITYLHHVDEFEIEYQYAVGDKNASGSVTFLFPEWTDISRKRLIAKAKGQEVVRVWIERGSLSDSVGWTYDLL